MRNIVDTYVFFKSWFCMQLKCVTAYALVAGTVPRTFVILGITFFS